MQNDLASKFPDTHKISVSAGIFEGQARAATARRHSRGQPGDFREGPQSPQAEETYGGTADFLHPGERQGERSSTNFPNFPEG